MTNSESLARAWDEAAQSWRMAGVFDMAAQCETNAQYWRLSWWRRLMGPRHYVSWEAMRPPVQTRMEQQIKQLRVENLALKESLNRATMHG